MFLRMTTRMNERDRGRPHEQQQLAFSTQQSAKARQQHGKTLSPQRTRRPLLLASSWELLEHCCQRIHGQMGSMERGGREAVQSLQEFFALELAGVGEGASLDHLRQA